MKYRTNQYNSKYRNNYYNYTSVAHDYQPSYDYQPKIPTNRRIKKIKKEKYVKVEENLKILSLNFWSTFVILATFIISVIFVEALTIQKKFEIDTLNATLKEISENNKNLETELAKNLDLEYVEYIASSELGMQKPASHQIVHINVPKESYTEKGQINNEETFISKIKNLLKK